MGGKQIIILKTYDGSSVREKRELWWEWALCMKSEWWSKQCVIFFSFDF